MNHGENFEYDLTPYRGWEYDDKPIRLSPTTWERIRTVARRRSVECELTGTMTLLQCRHLAEALRAAMAAGDFDQGLVPVVKKVVGLLGMNRGGLVQRRSASAGTALRQDDPEPVTAGSPPKELPAQFEQFRLNKNLPAR